MQQHNREGLAGIEADLGTQLIDRITCGVGPADAGRELAEHGRRIMLEVADAKNALGRAD
jgi:DNA-binding transcriptional LysR family regulator